MSVASHPSTEHATASLLRPAAVVALAATAVVHLALVPEHLEEMPYMGVLFIVDAALFAVAAVALLTSSWRRAGWVLGSLVTFGTVGGYVASRTVGLPGGYHEGWDDPAGTLCLVIELFMLGAAALAFLVHAREHRRL